MNVSSNEVLEVLNQVVEGKLKVKVVGPSWHEVFAGSVVFLVEGGYEITIFNDCDSLDYVNSVKWPDGRTADFDYWVAEGRKEDDWSVCNPLDTLRADDSLYKILSEAKPS